MSSGIISFLDGRDSAIKAWKMDGHIPLEEVNEEFGISADDLFHVGLLIEKGHWTDLQCYPYKVSSQGRLLLSHDEQYDILLVKPGCLEKLFLAVKKQDIEKLADAMRARHAKGGERKMSQQWSEEAQQATREMVESQSYGIRDGKLWCKHIDGASGYLLDDDALLGALVIRSPTGEHLAAFESIQTMLAAGWVLD